MYSEVSLKVEGGEVECEKWSNVKEKNPLLLGLKMEERHHKSRTACDLQKLEKDRKQILLQSLHKEWRSADTLILIQWDMLDFWRTKQQGQQLCVVLGH